VQPEIGRICTARFRPGEWSGGRQVFELHHESAAVRDRYGRHPLGQNLLLARRLVEAGVGFVTVNGWTDQLRARKAEDRLRRAGTCTAAKWGWQRIRQRLVRHGLVFAVPR